MSVYFVYTDVLEQQPYIFISSNWALCLLESSYSGLGPNDRSLTCSVTRFGYLRLFKALWNLFFSLFFFFSPNQALWRDYSCGDVVSGLSPEYKMILLGKKKRFSGNLQGLKGVSGNLAGQWGLSPVNTVTSLIIIISFSPWSCWFSLYSVCSAHLCWSNCKVFSEIKISF